MDKIVPLISSGVAGPLGLVHLPRFWQKVLLSAKNLLPEGYKACGPGYDYMIMDGLGVDKDAAVSYIKDSLPTYLEFEKWVIEQKGGSIDGDLVRDLNEQVRSYNHSDDVRKSILEACKREDDGTVLDAVNLNNLEDWVDFHASVVD